MKILIALSVLFLVPGNVFCQDSFTVKKDKYIQLLFNEKEINDLNSIVKYVDNEVLSKYYDNNINQAYHNYFESLSKKIEEDSNIASAFDEEEKYAFLKSLDKNTFKEIFIIKTHLDWARYKDTIVQNIDNIRLLQLNPSGKFIDYLEKTGESDDYYEKLHDSIKIAGDLPGSFATRFPVNHNDFDFNLIKNRLWAAVYLLRMEGHMDYKIEYYLNK